MTKATMMRSFTLVFINSLLPLYLSLSLSLSLYLSIYLYLSLYLSLSIYLCISFIFYPNDFFFAAIIQGYERMEELVYA